MSKVSADKLVATGRTKARKRKGKSSKTSKAGARFEPQIIEVNDGYTMIGYIGGIGPRK